MSIGAVLEKWRGRQSRRTEACSAGVAPECVITAAAYRQILAAVGAGEPERGMLLGGDAGESIVRHVVFDDSARCTGITYSPDHERLTRVLREWWQPSAIRLLGFAHSHPGNCSSPSGGDLDYAKRILDANPHLACLHLPIVTLGPEPVLHPFVVQRTRDGVEAKAVRLEVIDEVRAAIVDGEIGNPSLEVASLSARSLREETFRRVVGAYDLPHLSFCRVVVVGVGGAAGFVEDVVRAGIHDVVLIDPDIISPTNLTTQQVYRRDLGRPKVEALAERLRDINPLVRVEALQESFLELTETKIDALLGLNLVRPPIRTLLCGCTDNFFAQARINRVGLDRAVPTLCAQVYAEGRGAEITFTYPGVTPACHRCILRSRYEAYLDQGYENTVTSDGTPISSTTRLNATKFSLAMALLHHGTSHRRWGRLLERIGNRNLIQLRLDPDLALPVFDRVLAGDRDRILYDEAVWLPQQPEGPTSGHPACPDCGGGGDLRAAIGTIGDTRLSR